MDKVDNIFITAVGLDFPTTYAELEAFESVFDSKSCQIDEHLLDPYKILDLLKSYIKSDGTKMSDSQSYFRRAILAAKIVNEYYSERTFGIIKLQKLVYLAEESSSMSFASNYRKQAAGPMDHKFIHSIKKEFEKQKWFLVRREGEYNKWVFEPGEKVTAYEPYYIKYFNSENDNIQFLLDSFKTWRSEKVELVATVYACWKEIKEERKLLNDKVLIERFYSFHKAKSKFGKDDVVKGCFFATS